MNIFCTIINQDYVLRGLTLFRSMSPYLKMDKFIIFCIDDESYNILKNYKSRNLKLINTTSFENRVLSELRKKRKINEFCWTLKPICLSYIFKKFINTKWAVYLDSDSMVFKDFKNTLNDRYDILITPHNPSNKKFWTITKKVGEYNAGFIAFKKNYNSKLALDWWQKKCKQKCSADVTKKSYADQKYLNEFPIKFKNVYSYTFSGLNVAPWNITDDFNVLKFRKDKLKELIFYHMQGLKIYNKYIYKIYSENFKVDKETYKLIYLPYMRLLRKTYEDLKKLDVKFCQKKEFNINLKFLIKNYLTKNNNLKIIF